MYTHDFPENFSISVIVSMIIINYQFTTVRIFILSFVSLSIASFLILFDNIRHEHNRDMSNSKYALEMKY